MGPGALEDGSFVIFDVFYHQRMLILHEGVAGPRRYISYLPMARVLLIFVIVIDYTDLRNSLGVDAA